LLTAVGLTHPVAAAVQYTFTLTVPRTTQLTTLVGMLSGIRTQNGQTKINDELRKSARSIVEMNMIM
jgi:hypothetical protein